MTEIAVVVPVLSRPQNAQPLVDSLLASNAAHWSKLTWVVSPGDTAELEAIRATGCGRIVTADWQPGPGDFARKTNLAYALSAEPFVFCGADDLRFHKGWDTALLETAAATQAGVIGSNDLGNPQVIAGRHATHPLVRRSYINACGGAWGWPGLVYHEGYDHQWVDSELCELAKWRGCYAHAHGAVVEHRHVLWGKAEMDSTYRKAMAHGREDGRMFASRQALWMAETVAA